MEAVDIVPRGSLSYVLLRDFERRMFLQAEIAARYRGSATLALMDPTETMLPCSLGLRNATNLAQWTSGSNALGEAGRFERPRARQREHGGALHDRW